MGLQRADINLKRQTRFCREMLVTCGFQICRSTWLRGGLGSPFKPIEKSKSHPH